MIPSDIFWAVMRESTTINELGSLDHGPGHWARVLENARALDFPCDFLVVEYFALFHDAMRLSEFADPEHGERGWKLAHKLGVPDNLTETQATQLWLACRDHDHGYTSVIPTIGVCWDADRLDLPRVGIQPVPELLSTKAARELTHDPV